MKIAEKILILIIILSFAGGAFLVPYASAEDSRYEQAAETLMALGIAEGYEDGEMRLSRTLTRAEYVVLVYRALGLETTSASSTFEDVPLGHWAVGAIEACRSLGLVSGHSETIFAPDHPVTFEQAVKILVSALGYDRHAQSTGGYPIGYLVIASQLGVSNKVTAEADDIIKRGVAFQLVYNALGIDVAEQVGFGGEVTLVIKPGVSLLELRHDIISGKGIVTATHRSRLEEPRGTGKNQVEINDEIFEVLSVDNVDFLGYNVEYFAKRENGLPKIVYMRIRDGLNNEEIVKAENILKENTSFTTTRFVYTDETYKTYSLPISVYADLIYNGVALEDFTEDTLAPTNGRVKLLDNDGDGIYDVIFVTEYEIITMGGMGSENDTIYDLNNSRRGISLSSETQERELSISKGGKVIGLDSLQRNDVLSITKSANQMGTLVIEIQVSDKAVTGAITERFDNKIVIDGKEYSIAKGSENSLERVSIGTTGIFYVSTDDEIAAFEEMTGMEGNINYAYLIAADKEKGISSNVSFKLLTSAGQPEIYPGASKITLDGKIKQSGDVISTIFLTNGRIDGIVRYMLNPKGEINMIDTEYIVPEENRDGNYNESLDTLSKDSENRSLRYMTRALGLGRNHPELLIENDTTIFLIPGEADRYDETKYSTYPISGFTNYQWIYNIDAYDVSNMKVPRVIVIPDYSAPISDDTKVYIVTGTSEGINEEGEKGKKIHTLQNGVAASYFGAEENTLENVKTGQILRLRLNSNDAVDKVQWGVDPSVDEPKTIGFGTNALWYYVAWRINFGMLVEKEGDKILFATDPENPDTYLPYKISSSIRVHIYDRKTEKFNTGTEVDIEDYIYDRNPDARVSMIIYSSGAADIVLMK